MYTATVISTLSTLRQLWQSFYKTSYTYGDMNEDVLNPNKKKKVLP